MAYGHFKDLNRRTISGKVLHDKAFNIDKNLKYDVLASTWICFNGLQFFWWKNSGGTVKNEIISNKELEGELHIPAIRKYNKRKVHSPFIDNIWGADLADV